MAVEAAPRPGSGSARTLAWAGGSSAFAAVLVALTWVDPVLPLALLAVVVVVALAAFRPKAFVLLCMLVIVLATPIQDVLGSAGSYTDEGMVLLAVIALTTRRLVTEGRLVWLPGGGWFLGYAAFGLLSSVLAGVPASTTLAAGFISLKGVLFAFALAQVRWRREDLVVLVRLGIAAVVTVAVSAAVNLAAPTAWAQFTTGRPPINYVGPIPAINGIFQHPAAFSRFAGVLAVGCLVYGFVVRRSAANTVLLLLSGGLAALTFQVKSIVGMLATLAALGARFLRPVGIAAIIALGPLVVLAAAPPLVALVGGDVQIYLFQDSARSRLAAGGAAVADQFFPLGAGFGQYGSSTAADNYSPLYYALGFPDRYGLGPGPDSGQFLNDNQWPAIYGEAGWIGAFCFAAGLACMFVSLFRRSSPDEAPLVRWLRLTGIGWLILLLVESSASPVFVSPPSYPFVFAAAAIIASFRVAARDHRPAGLSSSEPLVEPEMPADGGRRTG